MSEQSTEPNRSHVVLLSIAFAGIFLYGLLAALPGSVLPTLERNQFLPNDNAVGTFLLINAVGAVLAYIVSGPIIDRIGNRFALTLGSGLVIAAMVGFAFTVIKVQPRSALSLIFLNSLVLGVGANAIVAAGHALVADIAASWRNAALNLLDICFGLGLASLPLLVQTLQQRGGLELIFWSLAGLALLILTFVIGSRFPASTHLETWTIKDAGSLFTNPSFILLALALFMYVGTEVSVGKWVVTFMERDPRILMSHGLDATKVANMSPEMLTRFFETDAIGYAVARYALRTVSFFAIALLVGRLISSIVLGVFRMNSYLLMLAGSLLTTIGLIVAFTANTTGMVRVGLIAAGLGMGPTFPTSVGLASVMAPRISGTAMSLVMGVGFCGLLAIPPAVGYVSYAAGGDVRTGLITVIVASALMLMFHVALLVRERNRANATPS